MRTSVFPGALFALAALPLAAQTPQRYTVSGDNVAIYNLAGAVHVEAGSAGDVVVEVTRGGSDGAKLDVQTGPIGTRQTLRVIYPGDDIIYPALGYHSSSTIDVRDDGTFDDNDHHFFGRGHRVRIRGDGSGVEAYADLRVLVPAGRRWGVHETVAAARRFQQRTGRMVSIEYCLLSGVNDTPSHARALAGLLREFRAHVNLIPYNPTGTAASGRTYEPSPPRKVENFVSALRVQGVVVQMMVLSLLPASAGSIFAGSLVIRYLTQMLGLVWFSYSTSASASAVLSWMHQYTGRRPL